MPTGREEVTHGRDDAAYCLAADRGAVAALGSASCAASAAPDNRRCQREVRGARRHRRRHCENWPRLRLFRTVAWWRSRPRRANRRISSVAGTRSGLVGNLHARPLPGGMGSGQPAVPVPLPSGQVRLPGAGCQRSAAPGTRRSSCRHRRRHCLPRSMNSPGERNSGLWPLSRRRFLQVLGTVGGAGAVLAAMEALDLVPSAREHTTPFQPPRASDFACRAG